MARNPQSADHSFPIAAMPVSAVQALYHAATGKTENLTKHLRRNFVVRKSDLDQLYAKLNQQLEHFEKVAGPTVSIKVKFNNGESQQFSSWSRFGAYDSGKVEIVSEVTIRYEFLIKLPDIDTAQRYVISIDLDSMLPVIADDEKVMALPFLVSYQVPSLTISIDFIDYLCAKNFSQIIEDWFNGLEESTVNKWLARIQKSLFSWGFLFSRVGYLGAAAFIWGYVWIRNGAVGTADEILYLVAIVIVFSTISTVFSAWLGSLFARAVGRSTIPAAIILTTGDDRAYRLVKENCRTAVPRLIKYLAGALIALFLNVLASFIYSWIKGVP